MENDTETEVLKDAPFFTNARIIKNVLLLSIAFLLICTSVDGLQMLQSTLNRNEGIGVVSIAIQFAFGCIIALFFMKYSILKLGTKMTLTFCILAHIPSTVANFYPHWLIMIPSYAIMGIAATLLWGSNSAYLNEISNKYAFNLEIKKTSPENELRRNELINTYDSNCFKNFTPLNDCCETDCRKYSNLLEQSVSSSTNKNCCTIRTIEKNSTANYKNITSIKNTNYNMSTVFELANATIQTIACMDKLDTVSSTTMPVIKSFSCRSSSSLELDNSSYTANSIVKSVAPSTTNTMDKLNIISSVMNPREKLDSDFSSTNTADKTNASLTTNPGNELDVVKNPSEKFDKASLTINSIDKLDRTFDPVPNSIIPVCSTAKAHHEQSGFTSLLVESTTARFFGIHSMFYQSGHIWSNIVSFYVLQRGVVNDTYIQDASCMCGADFCNIESECFEINLKEPSKEVKYLLISIFLALNILAVLLVAVFLDPLENRKTNVHYSMDFALATFNQLKRPLQLLIVPLSIYMGMSQAFFYADYPKAFVGCAWGMHHVGLVTITFGITCSAASTLSGWLVKHLGRRTIFLLAGIMNVAVNIIMLLWTPDSNRPIMFFVVAGMWGVIMGSFWSQLKAFHGVLFKKNEEAAFGCYELSHSIGACVSFACSNYICQYIKIYMLLFVSSIGLIGYLVAEKIRPQNK